MSEMPTLDRPWLMLGDCLERMREIPDGSVDMIACDLPYGTTSCSWDSIIPLDLLWGQYNRIIRKSGAIVLTASQPFTTLLISSKLEWFKYSWSWDKKNCTGFGAVKYRPLAAHEDVCVFAKGKTTYNPQMVSRTADELKRLPYKSSASRPSDQTPSMVCIGGNRFDNTEKYPSTVIRINGVMNRSGEKVPHPTQKPVALFEYLIRTYTNPGEVVLDSCFGSGTTGVACANTGRRFIGIERHEPYFDLGRKRIEQAIIAANQPAPFGGLFDAQAAE